jgi:NitT/TauT family transport system substrate-binding protein
MRVSRRRLIALTAAALAAPAAGLRAQGLDLVTVGALLSVSDASLLIADKKGYFRDAGIQVKFQNFDSAAQMIAPLGTGQLDAGGGAPSAGFYNAIARGIELKIVADRSRSGPGGYGLLPLVVRKDLVQNGKFKTFADLRGLKFAEPAKGTATIATIVRLLAKANLKYDDVQHVFLGFPEMVVALSNAGIDAALMLEPWGTQAVRSGFGVKIAGDDTWYPNQEIAVLIYAGDFTTKRPDVAKRFMVAYVKALRYYADALRGGHIAGPNADDIIGILAGDIKVSDPSIFREMAASTVDPSGRVDRASLAYDYGVIKDNGLLTGEVSMDKIIDLSYVENANKVLGPYRPRR